MALTELAVKSARPKDKPYKLFDERGLYLLVERSGGDFGASSTPWQAGRS